MVCVVDEEVRSINKLRKGNRLHIHIHIYIYMGDSE